VMRASHKEKHVMDGLQGASSAHAANPRAPG
jgi:hypothetical protein